MKPSIKALVLVNLGSPDAPTASQVRPWLKQFLSDPRVLDIPALLRFILLRCIILPFRSPKSAKAYQSIWTSRGSPLTHATLELTRKVAEELKSLSPYSWDVVTAMRYGNPSVPAVMAQLNKKGIQDITVIPLYPQHATSTTSTVLAEFYQEACRSWDVPALKILPSFPTAPWFVQPQARLAREAWGADRPQHVLFSFHGLPERHIQKSAHGNACQMSDICCQKAWDEGRAGRCYRAQCLATAQALANDLQLPRAEWSISFQSRLGRDKWLEPSTLDTLQDLRQKGVASVAVLCPAFVCDCLETLEEIASEAASHWRQWGGTRFVAVPCVNAEPDWVRGLTQAIVKFTSEVAL